MTLSATLLSAVAALAQAAPAATDANVAPWVQAGGLALFSACVWYELRQQRVERATQAKEQADRDEKLSDVLTDVAKTLEVLRDRAGFKSGPIRRLPGEVPVVPSSGRAGDHGRDE